MYAESRYSKVFLGSLPVAGKTGTLRTLLKGTPAEGRIRAKSGYISNVRSYAGYVSCTSGNELIFVIMVNNFSGSQIQIKKKLEQFMVSLVKL
jgi:D-alanyl-D-alanine carboxypeptidase/D-alanyl-D-alanine-endopeptidase (penicillin-binding protein 4)